MNQFHVPGMKCQRCVSRIVDIVKTRDRQATVNADPTTGHLEIESPIYPQIFEELVSDLGYRITQKFEK